MAFEQEGGKHPDDSPEEMTLVRDAGLLWENRPYHSTVDKEDDHRQGNRQPVPAQYANGKYEKHHAMRQPAGTYVIVLACE